MPLKKTHSDRIRLKDELKEVFLLGFDEKSNDMAVSYASPTAHGFSSLCSYILARSRIEDHRDYIILLMSKSGIYGYIRPFSYPGDREGVDFTFGISGRHFLEEPFRDEDIERAFMENSGNRLYDYAYYLISRKKFR